MTATLTQGEARWLPRLLRIWSLLALLTFGIMLTHQSDDPVFAGRYSSFIVVVLAGLLIVAIGLWAVSTYLVRHPVRLESLYRQLATLRAKRWFAPLVLLLGAVTLVSIWLFFLGDHLPTYALLRTFISLSIIMGCLALLYGHSDDAQPTRRTILVVIIGIVALLLVALVTIPYYPALLRADEAFDFSMARNALENGHVGPYIYRHSHPPDYFGGVWTRIMGAWLGAVGVSLESGRLYVLVLSAIALIFTWLAAARFYDRLTAWFAVLPGAYAFIALNHTRYHIHTAVWLAAGLFFFSLTQKRSRWWAHLAAGFAFGMGIDSNPVAYCFGVGLGLVYIVDYIAQIRENRRWLWLPFWWMAFGGALALGLYVALRSGDSFLAGSTTGSMLSFYAENTLGGLSSGLFVEMTRQYFNAFAVYQPLLLVLLALGVVTGFIFRSRSDRALLIIYFTWMVTIIFMYFYFPFFYIILGLPLFLILVGRGLAAGLPRLLAVAGEKGVFTTAAIGLLCLWLGVAVAKDLRELPSQSMEDTIEVGRQIGQLLPQDALIVGAEPYYFGMIDHYNFVGGSIEPYLINFKALTADEAWQTLAPDAVIFSQNWSHEPRRTPALVSYLDAQSFSMLNCYETQSFGHIELWVREIPAGQTPNTTCQTVCNPRTGC